jgi:RNA polymerase sigma-70 factor (ECF subfamily)
MHRLRSPNEEASIEIRKSTSVYGTGRANQASVAVAVKYFLPFCQHLGGLNRLKLYNEGHGLAACALISEMQVPGRSQRQLLRALRQGRAGACETLINQHYAAVYRFVAYLTGDPGDAEELTQETFAQAWANIGSFKGRASFATWLHRIAYTRFIDARRKQQRTAVLIGNLKQQANAGASQLDPLQQLVADEDLRMLYAQLRRLDQAERTVIVLHYVQGLTYRQMAKVLDVPVGTAKWQTSRALKKLRDYLVGRV